MALISATTEQQIKIVFTAMLQKAAKGDVKAAEFVFSYLFGKPVQTVGLQSVEGAPPLSIREVIVERIPPAYIAAALDQGERQDQAALPSGAAEGVGLE